MITCDNEKCGIRNTCYRFMKVPEIGDKSQTFKFTEEQSLTDKYVLCQSYHPMDNEKMFDESVKQQTAVMNIIQKEAEVFVKTLEDLGQFDIAAHINGWEILARRVNSKELDA